MNSVILSTFFWLYSIITAFPIYSGPRYGPTCYKIDLHAEKFSIAETDELKDIAKDSKNNVYTAGPKHIYKYSPAGELVWEKEFKDIAVEKIYVDSSDCFFAAGISLSDSCPAILKGDAEGDVFWQKVCGSENGIVKINDLTQDKTGNIYLAGEYFNKKDIDCIIIKLDPKGDFYWQKLYNAGIADQGFSVVADADSNVYVTGSTIENNCKKCLILKYSSSGGLVWARSISRGHTDIGRNILVGLDGDIYVSCDSENELDFDLLLAKYKPNGEIGWQRIWHGGGDEYGYGFTASTKENVCIAGYMKGEKESGLFVLQYDLEGNLIWVARNVETSFPYRITGLQEKMPGVPGIFYMLTKEKDETGHGNGISKCILSIFMSNSCIW